MLSVAYDDRARCSIPPLDEIVAPQCALANCGPYSRANFVAYLASSHCTENLEFIVELDRFIAALSDLSRANLSNSGLASAKIAQQDLLTHHWLVLYKVFIAKDSIKEVNIPWSLRSTFMENQLPLLADLAHTRAVVYELLLDNYNEFILHTRECTNDLTSFRRRLEIVAPDQPLPIPASSYNSFNSTTSCYSSLDHDVAPCAPCSPATPVDHDQKLSSAACLKDQWEKALRDFEMDKCAHSVADQPTPDSYNYGLSRSRNGSEGTVSSVRTSSRGSSIGSMVDGIKNYSNLKKAVKKFKQRRSLAEGVDVE